MKLRQFLNNAMDARCICLVDSTPTTITLRGRIIHRDGKYFWGKYNRIFRTEAELLSNVASLPNSEEPLYSDGTLDDAITNSPIMKWFMNDYLQLDDELVNKIEGHHGWYAVVIHDIPRSIYTHDIAAEVVECFEDMLMDNNICIECADKDETADRIESNGENDTGLYGSEYYALLDAVETIIIDALEAGTRYASAPTMSVLTAFEDTLTVHDVKLNEDIKAILYGDVHDIIQQTLDNKFMYDSRVIPDEFE